MDLSACFNSALVDLEILEENSDKKPFIFRSMKGGLRNLRTFLVCARKWGNDDDVGLGALLGRIEEAVFGFAREIHSYCLSSGWETADEVGELLYGYQDHFQFYKQEIRQWYMNFSSDSSSQQYGVFDKDELLDLISFVLEILAEQMCLDYRVFECLEDPPCLQALKEQLTFLKNFTRFTTLRGIDDRHLQHLLASINALALNAAHYGYVCQFPFEDEFKQMKFRIWGLVQRIKPTDRQVYETYAQVLTASKLSRPSQTSTLETDLHILGDFIDSLLSNLWEILMSGTFPVLPTKNQPQILYEGLRSLRSILRKQPKIFDEEIWDLAGIVVCDAGIVICSLFLDEIEDDLAKEMELVLFDFLDRIKLIRAKVTDKSPEGSAFNFPKVDELGFVDFLLENLTALTNCEAGSTVLSMHQIHTIRAGLVFLRSFVGKIVELRNEQEELQSLWNRVMELAYRTDFLIDSFLIGGIPDSSPLSFDSIIEEIKILKSDIFNISDGEDLDIKVQNFTKRSNHLPLDRSIPIIKDYIVPLIDEATSVMDRLKRGANQLQIVAIVGMPGLGKTTLAKLVYNDSSILSHFHIRAWCCITQVYDKKSILLEILTCILVKLPDDFFKKSEEDLALELYRKLKRQRYLIVLDDVWDIAAWNSLEATFPNDGNQSRILLTSRIDDVAPKKKLDAEPHRLRQLTDDESWKLLKSKMFPRNDWPSTLHELGNEIVKSCKGLPLSIVILTGMLSTMEQDDWKEIIGHLSSCIVSRTELCKNVLELSYRHLPDKLKPCFLYFGAFPEGEEVTAKKLKRLWIAEGFVHKTQSKSLEDMAEANLVHLISRSLVMIAKQSSTGGVKTCRIHDLLHEFCVEKAKEERFFWILRGYDELYDFNDPHNLRRLCIHSKVEDFRESRIFCPHVRCLLFFARGGRYSGWSFDASFVTGILKLVRVLDLSQFPLGFTFPSEMQFLVHLRYLELQISMRFIPSSIANLSNLETFIVHAEAIDIALPENIWSLKKLRHLHITPCFDLPSDDLNRSAELWNLDTFSTVVLSCKEIEKVLRKFPNIRKLKVILKRDGTTSGESNKVLVLDNLNKLESLSVKAAFGSKYEFCFPLNLRKLTLSAFRLPWCKISAIGNLPNLEVLKLLRNAFSGEVWDMEETGQFSKVRFLKLTYLDIVRWTASESGEHFPSLVNLELERCRRLKEFPSCLENISTLQLIKVSYCSPSVKGLAKEILEEQKSMGNENMRVIFRSYRDTTHEWREFGS